MSQDLFDLLNPTASVKIQDADKLSVTPLAPVPFGPGVFASEAEKTALMREEGYTRKGSMPERQITRQQFIEDLLARGFNQRSEYRRGSVMVTKFENPANKQYYILNRTFERDYANRRYNVLFPAKSAGPSVAPVLKTVESAAIPAAPVEQVSQGTTAAPAVKRERKDQGAASSSSSPTPPTPSRSTSAPAESAAQASGQGIAVPVAQEVTNPAEDPAEKKSAKKTETPKPELKPEERDFSYTPAEDFTPRGRKTRIAANLAALALVKKLDAEDRLATPEEKAVLAKYCGWGADKACFDTEKVADIAEFTERKASMKQRFGATHPYYTSMTMEESWVKWLKEFGPAYQELKNSLSEEEWASAAQSVLNAHYTEEPIAHRLWSIARRIGFEGGAVAEFGCGTGKIIGAMPAELREKSTILGVERDSVTAQIAKKLFPQATIEEAALQDLPIRPNSVDLVIGNVPFSDISPSGQNGKTRFNLHNYFISRGLEALKPGGLAVLITSVSTMENNEAQRQLLADRGELLGAIRLPNDAFQGNANTEVVTDILVLRKPTVEMRVPSETFRRVLVTEVPEGQEFHPAEGDPENVAQVNEYFVRHPEMVLGVHSLNGKMYGAADEGQYTVVSLPNMPAIADRIDAAIGRLPEQIPNSSMNRRPRNPLMEEGEALTEELAANRDDKVGSIVSRGDKLFEVSEERELVAPSWHKADFKLPRGIPNVAAADRLVGRWMEVRDALRQVIATDLNPMANDRDSERARTALRRNYEGFVEDYGRINEHKGLRAMIRFEPEYGCVEALENVREVRDQAGKRQRLVQPAAILTTRTLRPSVPPGKADSILDAVMISMGQHGRIDLDYVCALIGKDDKEAIKKLLAVEGVAYENPVTGELDHRQQYLTGNVLAKLEAAVKAAESDGRFAINVEALRGVQPIRVPFDQIRAPLGASWIPVELVNDFARETFDQDRDFQVDYFPRGCTWLVPDFGYSNKLVAWQAASKRGTIKASEIFENVLAQFPIRITYTVDSGDGNKTILLDEQGTANANERADAMRSAWVAWLKRRPEAKALLENVYNETFNKVVMANPDGRSLTFPGLASGPGALVPRTHQRNGTMRVLTEQAGIVHYGVGFGKTMVGILSAREAKRMGVAQKPMILCDNCNYAQFVATMIQAYPQARILYSTDEDMKMENRERFKNRIATGDWDTVLMQRSHFERVPVSWETEAKWLADELADIRAVKEQVDSAEKDNHSRSRGAFARRMAKALEAAQERLKDSLAHAREHADRGLTWEQLGIDFLIVDESHREKKTGFNSRFEIKGIDPTASQRGRGLLMKARHIQDKRDGKGVIGMSGTVCTNTMAEYWSAMRLFHPKMLENFGVPNFDDYKTAFCQTEDALELNEANGRWRVVNRLSKFINGPAFVQFIRSGMDVQMDSAAVQLNVPKFKGGEIELCSVPLTDPVFDKMDRLAKIYEAYEKSPVKKELSWVPIVLMQCGMAASIDPRLVDRNAPDDAGSLVNKLVSNVSAIHRETAERRSTQCIFLDRYRTMDTSILSKVEKGGLKSVQIELDDADKLPGGVEEEDEPKKKEAAELAPSAAPSEFNLYQDIKAKLIADGIPAGEIAIIHDCKNADERKELFSRIDAGEIRVIMGSSDKIGVGANYQRKLYAAHHLDPARNMTPDQMEQRNGRILRDGNENPEVRVIYYGMQDTVTPAVWGRLQRKAAFIKQGLAAKGVGIEFEDTGEIRIEEMKSALISDKRQLRRGEMLAEIKEQKVQREVTESRSRNLRSNLADQDDRIARLQKELPEAQVRAALYERGVTPPFARLDEWSFALSSFVRLRPPEEADEKTIKAITKANEMIDETKGSFVGEQKETLKRLDKLVDALKVMPLGSSNLVREFGVIRINGLPIKLSKEQTRLALSGEESVVLVANVYTPQADTEMRRESQINSARFGSAEALFKLTQATYEQTTMQPQGMAKRLESLRIDREESALLVQSAAGFDESRMAQLQAELVVLEKDMREKPFIRGSDRGKAKAAKEAAGEQPAQAPAPLAFSVPEMPAVAAPRTMRVAARV